MHNRLVLCIVMLLSILDDIAVAQYSFDLKVPSEEARGLEFIKAGVSSAIEQAAWATETETGEDFSLWLLDFARRHDGDSLEVSLSVQLRTPAMFTRGYLIAEAPVTLRYHWEKTMAFVANSDTDSFTGIRDADLAALESFNDDMISVASTPLGASVLGASAASSLLYGGGLIILVSTFEKISADKATKVDYFEGGAVGNLVLNLVQEMVSDARQK